MVNNDKYKIKRISEKFEYCNECGMLVVNCICNKISRFKSEVEFWVLTLERELYRPSNTARLLKLVNPLSTRIFLWERKVEPKGLLALLNNSLYDVFLLFPIDSNEDEIRRVEYRRSERKTAFIIIDGTWKEARRIIKKSTYLNNIPIVSIENGRRSKYKFRRGATLSQLCTYEAALEVLNMNEEKDAELIGRRNFELFLSHFEATVHSHKKK